MRTITKLATGLLAAALTVAVGPVAAADPTVPLDPGQLPGLQAVQSLSPVVQQAAADPTSAQELLLAAASQLAGNATTPEGSLSLAQAVAKFVQEGGAASLTPPAAAVVDQAAGPAHGTTPLLTPGPGNGPIPLEQHVPAPGAAPGAEAHLPTGINPERAVGPQPGALPEVPTAVAAPPPPPAPPAPDAPPPAAVPAALAQPAPAPGPPTPYDPATPPSI